MNVSIVMRAFRATDNSHFTWRAGAYDPNMEDAVGDQAPPFPILDYTDPVMIGFLETPLARTDPEATPLPGLGTPGTPITFSQTPATSRNTDPGLDCRDFRSVTVWVFVTNPGTATTLSMFAAWSGKDAAVFANDGGFQRSDDSISSGASPQNIYSADYPMPLPAGVPTLGPFNVPVRGRRFFFSLQADTADVQGYAVAMRHA